MSFDFIQKSFEQRAKEIDQSFDWEKVHKVMLAIDWHWTLGKDKFGNDLKGVPDILAIKNHAFNILEKAYLTKFQHCSGGFSSGWDDGRLFLVFSVEESIA